MEYILVLLIVALLNGAIAYIDGLMEGIIPLTMIALNIVIFVIVYGRRLSILRSCPLKSKVKVRTGECRYQVEAVP